MGTPLYNTDVIPATSRPTLTVMDDGDYFLIFDTSTAKISKILKTNVVLPASQSSYDNTTSGLTATQVQAALDELVVNLGSSDSAISALDGRLDTAEGEIDDLETLTADHETRIDTTELAIAKQGQDLASVKQTLQHGNGATLDFSGIGSVPLDARATGRANPTVEGRTATNLVTNGDFSQGATGWVPTGSNGGVLTITNKIVLNGTSTGSGGFQKALTQPPKVGDVIAVVYDGVYLSGSKPTINLRNSVAFTTQLLGVFMNGLNSIVVTVNADGYDNLYVRQNTGDIFNNATLDNFCFINLTSIYGAGNEPSASDCAKIFSYFDGTKSIQMPARVRSVGKNLLEFIQGINYTNHGVTFKTFGNQISVKGSSSAYTYVTIMKIPANSLPSGTYTVSKKAISGSSTATIRVIDRTATPAIILGPTFSSTANVHELNIEVAVNISTTYDEIFTGQLERSAVATPYEPYQDSTLYIADDSELRSVPAISDEVKVVNGELVKVQNVQRYVLQASDIVSIETSLVNCDFVRVAKRADYEYYNTFALVVGSMVFNEIVDSMIGALDATANIGKVSNNLSATNTLYFVAKDTYASLAEAQADLAGTIIYYQLATPIITPLTTSGILQAKPNGAVHFEPYYEGSNQTNASSQITLPYTGTIDKLTGYDENLEPYEVPSTAYTLVGTTLTITGAEENEVYYVELSRTEPLAPEMSVNVINNDQVTLDSVNGKYYKITHTTANGVPTTVATEVL